MNSTKSKLLITAGLFAAVAVASGVSQRCSAQVTPDALLVACGRLQNGDQQGVFSATYDPATITSTGQAVYRLQDNVMNGKRSVETGNMSVSQVGADLILSDCAYVGLL